MAKSPGPFVVICDGSPGPSGRRVMQGLLEFRLIRTYVPTAFDRLAAADLFICWVRDQVTLQPAAGEDRAGAAILCGSGPRHVPSPGAGGRRGHRCREGV